MVTTRVFQNGNSQALRIPQEMRTEKKEFIISKVGDTYIAYPAEDAWLPVRQALGAFSEDYMQERMQPDWSSVSPREEI